MAQRALRVFLLVAFANSFSLNVLRGDDPPTHTVRVGLFRKDISVPGRVETTEYAEVRAQFKHFTTLKVDYALPDGSVVAAGDVVMSLDRKDYDRQLELRRIDQEVAQIGHHIATIEFRREMESQRLELQQLRTQLENLEADRRYYVEYEHPKEIESTKKNLAWSESYLEDAREELRQLERMYQEDELVEESEELVLRRTRRSVEQSEYYAEQSRESTRRQLEVFFPRQFKQSEVTFVLEQLRLQSQIQLAESNMARRQMQWKKTELEFANAQKDYEEFLEEGRQLELRAPRDGIFVHGEIDRGTLTGSRRWRKNDPVAVDQIVGTVYGNGPRQIRVDIPEEVWSMLKVGMKAHVIPKAHPNWRMRATIQQIGLHAMASGSYDGIIALADPEEGRQLSPGMSCDVKVSVFVDEQAIAIPSKAIFSDDEVVSYVLVKKGENVERRVVEPGLVQGEQTQIKSGLSADEVILLEKPK